MKKVLLPGRTLAPECTNGTLRILGLISAFRGGQMPFIIFVCFLTLCGGALTLFGGESVAEEKPKTGPSFELDLGSINEGYNRIVSPVPGPTESQSSSWTHLIENPIKVARLGTQFVVPSGTVTSGFYYVDTRPGSFLDRWIKASIQNNALNNMNLKQQIKMIFELLSQAMKPLPNDFVPYPELVELNQKFLDSQAWKNEGRKLSPGSTPLPVGFQVPSFPLERFLEIKSGNCLVRALLAALIFRALGHPVRVVQGQTEISGHSWLELGDNLVIDPTFQWAGPKNFQGAWNGWYFIDRTAVSPYRSYIYLRAN